MDDLISRQAAIDALYHVDEYNGRSVEAIRNLPSAQPEQKGYTKAEYIMALHKEYGVDFARAEEAHNRALEYLRSTAMMKG